MGRTKGLQNKEIRIPKVYSLSLEERIEMLAAILVDIISEDLCKTE